MRKILYYTLFSTGVLAAKQDGMTKLVPSKPSCHDFDWCKIQSKQADLIQKIADHGDPVITHHGPHFLSQETEEAPTDSPQLISDAPKPMVQDCYYSLDPSTISVNEFEGSISAQLNQMCDSSLASELQLSLWFYQNGIMRALIDEEDSGRFRITKEGIPVVDAQLESVMMLNNHILYKADQMLITNLNHNDGSEVFSYTVNYDHFEINQYANDVNTLVINPMRNSQDTLQVHGTK